MWIELLLLGRLVSSQGTQSDPLRFDEDRDVLVTEIYQPCNYEEGKIAGCHASANCYVIDNTATCHCAIDVATGLPLAGNPYRGCTWDITGVWELRTPRSVFDGGSRVIINPFTLENVRIKIVKTDALLKTAYITGSMFNVYDLAGGEAYSISRALLDVNDNQTVIFVANEGFVDNYDDNIILRAPQGDVGLTRKSGHSSRSRKRKKGGPLQGHWQRTDGSPVKIYDWKKMPKYLVGTIPKKDKHHRHLLSEKKRPFPAWPNHAYWFKSEAFGMPLVQLSMALFEDVTLPQEALAYQTSARFVQTGYLGTVDFGGMRMAIYSPADGKVVAELVKIDAGPMKEEYTPDPQVMTMSMNVLQNMAQQFLGQEEGSGGLFGRNEDDGNGGLLAGILGGGRRLDATTHNDEDRFPVIEPSKIPGSIVRRLQQTSSLLDAAKAARAADLSQAFNGQRVPQAATTLGQRGAVPPPTIPPLRQTNGYYGLDESAYNSNPYKYIWDDCSSRMTNAEKAYDESFFQSLFGGHAENLFS